MKLALFGGENLMKIIYLDRIIMELVVVCWNYTSTNVNIIYQDIINNIEKTCDKILSLQKMCVYNKAWINEKVVEARRARERERKPLRNSRYPE